MSFLLYSNSLILHKILIERGPFFVSRKGENIYKRKDGRWEGRFIKEYGFDGKPQYKSVYGQSYSEVKMKLKDVQADFILGREPKTNHLLLYSDLTGLWLASKKLKVKEATFARYFQLINTQICPILGNCQVDEITTAKIEQFSEKLLTKGRIDGQGGLSPKTVSDILTIIKSTLKYAKQRGYIVNCELDSIYIRKAIVPVNVLSLEDQKRLCSFLLCDTNFVKLGVIVSLYTGIRIGELCALRWKNIDVNEGMIEIRETMQRVKNVASGNQPKTKIIITEPKSACSMRIIPIPTFLIEILRPYQQESEAFLLTGNAEHYIEPRTMQNNFKRYLRAAGLKNTNFHVLRHTFATRCIESGFDVKSLSEILGHANVNITLNRYVHSSMQYKRENMDRLKFF